MNHILLVNTNFFDFFQRHFKSESSFSVQWKSIFQQILTLAGGNVFSVSQRQCFLIRAVFLLVETIIGIRGKQFSNKKLILPSGKLNFRLVETIFSSIFRDFCYFFPPSGEVFFNKILHSGQQKRISNLIMVSTRSTKSCK